MGISFVRLVCSIMEATTHPARKPSAGAVPGRWRACLAVRTPPAALLHISEITARDDLASVAGHQFGKDADVERGTQETHLAVREYDIGPAGVETVDFSVVGAIHGTRPVEGSPVRRGASAPQQVSRGPRAAGEPDVRDLAAPLPQLRPARA